MNNEKEEPLNTNYHKRIPSMRKRRRMSPKRGIKKDSKLFIKINILFIFLFIISISGLGYFIYIKLNNIEDVKLAINEKGEEIEYENKVNKDLKEKIKEIDKLLDEKEKNVLDINDLYEHEKAKFQMKKKIYENLKELYDKSEEENKESISLDEAIKNLNERINNINK